MKVTIRVEITTDWNETENFEVTEIERQYCELDQSKIGLSLAEGKDVQCRPVPITTPNGCPAHSRLFETNYQTFLRASAPSLKRRPAPAIRAYVCPMVPTDCSQ